MDKGDLELNIDEVMALFDEEEQVTPPVDEAEIAETPPSDSNTDVETETAKQEVKTKNVETTRAFSERLKERTTKAVMEERETIAKSLGYASYTEMLKKSEEKMYTEKGLDPKEVSPLVDELVKQRLDNDPRMKELAALRTKQVEEFGRRELAEITKLTNGEVTKLSQLPKEVIDLWKTRGSLKSAFLEVKGEELIIKARSAESKGSTDHLKNPTGNTPVPTGTRLLTAEEKKAWKIFNPGISEEELNKKTTKK